MTLILTQSQMADLLMGQYNAKYDKIVIIDCRYQFEFDGGHIRTAINVSRPTDVESIYYQYLKQGRRVCIIFHCEFSSHRGPKMYVIFFVIHDVTSLTVLFSGIVTLGILTETRTRINIPIWSILSYTFLKVDTESFLNITGNFVIHLGTLK